MAIRWIGTTGAWSTGANWTGGVVPATSDSVEIVNNGAVDITSGLNQTTVNLTSLYIGKDCPIQIGSSGSPLILDIATLTHLGDAPLFWTPESAVTSNDAYVDSPNTSNALTLSGTVEPNRVYVLGGRVTVSSGMTTINNHFFVCPVSPSRRAYLDFAGTSGLKNLYIMGGEVTAAFSFTRLVMGGGILEYTGTGSIEFIHQTGGLLYYSSGHTLVGTQEIHVLGGTFDCNNALATQALGGTFVGPQGTLTYNSLLTTFPANYSKYMASAVGELTRK